MQISSNTLSEEAQTRSLLMMLLVSTLGAPTVRWIVRLRGLIQVFLLWSQTRRKGFGIS